MSQALTPSMELLLKVQIAFRWQGTSLHGWCRKNRVHITGARQALIGTWNGPKGRGLRTRIVEAAKLDAVVEAAQP
jgi:hypothetical protein